MNKKNPEPDVLGVPAAGDETEEAETALWP